MAVYAIFTQEGLEGNLKNEIEEWLIRPGEEVYLLMNNRLKKFDGEYKIITRPLFPGYVFVNTEDEERLRAHFRRNTEISKLLYSPEANDNIVLLSEEEEKILDQLCGKDHVLDISTGYKDENGAHITSGPLVGMENMIKKINRHKRIAVIEIDIFSKRELIVGLEIPDVL